MRKGKSVVMMIAAVLLVMVLGGCAAKVDPFAPIGFRSLELDKEGKTVTAEITIDARTLSKTEGRTLYLYEIPHGGMTVPSGAEPIAQAKIGANVRLRFPLMDGERSRLYSAFAIGLEDGTMLAIPPHHIENPTVLAQNRDRFAWSGSPKGLWDADADLAAELGAMHVTYSLSLSELFTGTDKLSFDGVTYQYAAEQISRLDRLVKASSDAGLQVSIRIVADTQVSGSAFAAAADLLANRYSTAENGTVSAFFIDVTSLPLSTPSSDAAQAELTDRAVCYFRLANTALRARVANGRVYVTYKGESTESKAFFADLGSRLSTGGDVEWGAAIGLPPLTEESVRALPAYFAETASVQKASWIAVSGLTIDNEDPDAQAATLAFAYRCAVNAKATLVFYTHAADDLCGLRTQNGTPLRSEAVFRELDSALSAETESLCRTRFGEDWTSLPVHNTTNRPVTGSATTGSSSLEERTFFDFHTGETYGFSGVGSASAPKSHESAVFSAPVLYTWLSPVHSNEAGVRKLLTDPRALDGALTLTVQLLSQAKNASSCTLRLGLVGTSKDGSRLTYSSNIEILNGSWQTATFQISNFVSVADLSKTCILTLTVEPDVETDEPYVLWVRGMNLRNPDRHMGGTLTVALIVGGTLVGFAVVFSVYFLALRRREQVEKRLRGRNRH